MDAPDHDACACAEEAVDDESLAEEAFDARRNARRSGARIFTLLRKQVFDFSFLAASTSTIVTVRRALSLGQYHYLWLGVRIHNIAIDTGSLVLDAYRTLPSRQDPAEFTNGTQYMRVTVNSSDTAPKLETDTAAETFGPYLKFLLHANQGAGGGRVYAELSAVLLARPA